MLGNGVRLKIEIRQNPHRAPRGPLSFARVGRGLEEGVVQFPAIDRGGK